MTKKVTGIGGIFFKSANSEKSKEWYAKHLGIPAGDCGHTFKWRELEDSSVIGTTVWSVSNDYFKEPTTANENNGQAYMINYRVHNLVELLGSLKNEGVEIVGELSEYPYGKFAHILDLEGNKIELWEPVKKEDSK